MHARVVSAVVVVAVGMSVETPAAKAGGALAVRHARKIAVRDSANLHEVGGNGNVRTAEGPVSGTLPGTAHVVIRVSAVSVSDTTVTVQFTFYGSRGSITGSGSGTFHFGLSTQASFAGKGVISRGTGRYRHAHGSGDIHGAVDTLNRSGTFQVIGHLSY
jgi:hypothetical protein